MLLRPVRAEAVVPAPPTAVAALVPARLPTRRIPVLLEVARLRVARVQGRTPPVYGRSRFVALQVVGAAQVGEQKASVEDLLLSATGFALPLQRVPPRVVTPKSCRATGAVAVALLRGVVHHLVPTAGHARVASPGEGGVVLVAPPRPALGAAPYVGEGAAETCGPPGATLPGHRRLVGGGVFATRV